MDLTSLWKAFQNVLHCSVAGSHHGKEVANAVDGARAASDLLLERVAEVVCRVRADDEHVLPALGHLNRYTAGRSGLAYPTLSTNEYPFQGAVDELLKSGG